MYELPKIGDSVFVLDRGAVTAETVEARRVGDFSIDDRGNESREVNCEHWRCHGFGRLNHPMRVAYVFQSEPLAMEAMARSARLQSIDRDACVCIPGHLEATLKEILGVE